MDQTWTVNRHGRRAQAAARRGKGGFGWRQTKQRIGSGWRIQDWIAR
jgi:hypothetical protein